MQVQARCRSMCSCGLTGRDRTGGRTGTHTHTHRARAPRQGRQGWQGGCAFCHVSLLAEPPSHRQECASNSLSRIPELRAKGRFDGGGNCRSVRPFYTFFFFFLPRMPNC
jgi:hypothetical protein